MGAGGNATVGTLSSAAIPAIAAADVAEPALVAVVLALLVVEIWNFYSSAIIFSNSLINGIGELVPVFISSSKYSKNGFFLLTDHRYTMSANLAVQFSIRSVLYLSDSTMMFQKKLLTVF